MTQNNLVTKNGDSTVTWYFDISSLPKSEKTMRSEFHGINDVSDDVTDDVTIKLYRKSSKVRHECRYLLRFYLQFQTFYNELKSIHLTAESSGPGSRGHEQSRASPITWSNAEVERLVRKARIKKHLLAITKQQITDDR